MRTHYLLRYVGVLSLVLALGLGLTACDDDDGFTPIDRPERDATEYLIFDAPGAVQTLFGEAGLTESLRTDDGEFSLVLPSGGNFATLALGNISSIDGLAEDIAQDYVVEGRILPDDLTPGSSLTTLSGRTLTVSEDGDGNPLIGGAPVIIPDGFALENGYVHFVEGTFLDDLTAYERTAAQTSFSELFGALNATDLAGAFEGAVFAPTNTAFGAIVSGSLSGELLSEVLTYHVLAEGVGDGGTLETAEGSDLTVTVEGGVPTAVNGVPVANVLEAENGTIYEIDALLLQSLNAVERATTAPSLTTLAGAVTETGLDEALSGDGPFTIFAPTNTAFGALSPLLSAGEDDDGAFADRFEGALANVLQYHVVSGEFASEDLTTGTLTTLEGTELDIEVADTVAPFDSVTVNGTAVTTTDIDVSNGVVHIIDGVLQESITATTEHLLFDPTYSELYTALEAAELIDTVDGLEALTLFAPTNDAFAALDPVPTGDSLVNTLLFHVVPGEAQEQSALNDVTLETALVDADGANPAVLLTDVRAETDQLVIDELPGDDVVLATDTDIEIDNGIIHRIGRVLPVLPTADFAFAAEGLTVTFTDASSTPTRSDLTYAWDFGVDAEEPPTSTEPSPMFTYEAAGEYEVTLTVTDPYGLSSTATETVTVEAPDEGGE